MTSDIGGSFLPFNIANSAVPQEGPKAVRIPLDFTVNQSLMADLTMLTQGQPNPQMSYVQTLFVDNSASASAMYIQSSSLSQTVIIPSYSQAYIPFLQPNNPKIIFTNAGAVVCQAFALNFPVSPAVWAINNPFGNATFVGGSLKVSDVILDALVGNYNTYGNSLAVADLGLHSLISGGALKVTGGGGGGGVNTANLSTGTDYQGIGAGLAIAATAGKSITVLGADFWLEPGAWSSAAAGDYVMFELRDGSGGTHFSAAIIGVPGSATPSAYLTGPQSIRDNDINYELTQGNALYVIGSTVKSSSITFTGPNPGLGYNIRYLLQ